MTPILRTVSCPPDPVRADSAWAAHSRPRSNHDDLESPWSLPVPPAPRLRAITLPQVSPLVPVLEPATQIFANLDWTLSGITYPLSLRHTRSTYPATGPNALPLGYTPDSPIQSALGSEWSSDVSPSSPTHTTASSLLAEPSLLYTPLSPQLTPPVHGHNGPAYDRIRARSSVPSPKFKRATPQLPPPSPLYIPPTPAYSPPSPEYTPTSPAYSPPSPMYNPACPTWSPPLPSPAPRAQPLPLLYTTGICPTPKLPQRQAHTRTATSPTSRDRHLPLLYTAGSYSTPKSSHGRVLKRVAPRPSDPNLPFPKAKVTPTTLAFARRGLHSVPMIRSRGAMYPARRGPPAFVISDPMTWRATKGYSDADERAF